MGLVEIFAVVVLVGAIVLTLDAIEIGGKRRIAEQVETLIFVIWLCSTIGLAITVLIGGG